MTDKMMVIEKLDELGYSFYPHSKEWFAENFDLKILESFLKNFKKVLDK